MMNTASGIRWGIVATFMVLGGVFGLDLLWAQPGRGPIGPRPITPAPAPSPRPIAPIQTPAPAPTPNPYVPPQSNIPRPSVPPISGNPQPYIPPQNSGPVFVRIWKCSACSREVGRGDMPQLSNCPFCGVRFINGPGGANVSGPSRPGNSSGSDKTARLEGTQPPTETPTPAATPPAPASGNQMLTVMGAGLLGIGLLTGISLIAYTLLNRARGAEQGWLEQ
jgi:hypothetical protein